MVWHVTLTPFTSVIFNSLLSGLYTQLLSIVLILKFVLLYLLEISLTVVKDQLESKYKGHCYLSIDRIPLDRQTDLIVMQALFIFCSQILGRKKVITPSQRRWWYLSIWSVSSLIAVIVSLKSMN